VLRQHCSAEQTLLLALSTKQIGPRGWQADRQLARRSLCWAATRTETQSCHAAPGTAARWPGAPTVEGAAAARRAEVLRRQTCAAAAAVAALDGGDIQPLQARGTFSKLVASPNSLCKA